MSRITTVVFWTIVLLGHAGLIQQALAAQNCSREQVFVYPQEGQRSPVILDEALLRSRANIRPGYDDWLVETRRALLASNFSGQAVSRLEIWRNCQNQAEVRVETFQEPSPVLSGLTPAAVQRNMATARKPGLVKRIFSFMLRAGTLATPIALAFATGGTSYGAMMLPGTLNALAPQTHQPQGVMPQASHLLTPVVSATASLPKSGFRLSGRNDSLRSGTGFSGSRPAGFSSMRID